MVGFFLMGIMLLLFFYTAYSLGHYSGYKQRERELGLPEYDHSNDSF